MLNRIYIIILSLVLPACLYGQENNIAIGTWRVHLPYSGMKALAVGQDRVYAGQGSSILYYDRAENALNIESKYTGLNDVLVSSIGYNSLLGTFILGYETGNIDLIKEGSVTNVNDILRNNLTGSKKINHILAHNEYAYVAGDYGVVLYNLAKKEVKESYLALAPNSSANPVYATTLTKDSIYLATARGVMVARLSPGVNLLDFGSWYTFQVSDSIDTVNVVSVCTHKDVVYAAVKGKGIYYYNGSKWRKTPVPVTAGNARSLTHSGNAVLACMDTAVFRITSPSSYSVLFQKENITPMEACFDNENNLWIASAQAGLVLVKNGQVNTLYPEGPLSNRAFRFHYYNNNMVVVAGGYNRLAQKVYNGSWFSTFENNTNWKIARFDYPSIPSTIDDVVSVSYNSVNATLYASSYGSGLIAIKPDQSVQIYTSPIVSVGGAYLVGETTVDKDGNLWVPNRGTTSGQPNIHKLSPQGVWTSYDIYPGAVSPDISKNAIDVVIDDFDNKWIRCYGSGTETGIIIFNEKTNKSRTLYKNAGSGNLPDVKVNCIAKDKKGNMIVGTDKGIAVCYDPYAALNNGADLVTPIFEGFPILYERNVLSIAVDGGNRKWVGTNDGLWLFDEDLTKVLLYFDTENSPLLSDYIMDIQINDNTGEVFFATQEGVVAYRGTSTEGVEKYDEVKVFPNPVKPGFQGLVGISGLVTDAKVKITDAAGNLVYETTAAGGTAVWNVKDYNGNKAATGVYLIFCATAEGKEKFVSKIAVVE